ncbi:MAG: threonine--tRNA ligase [Deltaproteobacteria bacterium]|nr:threonine--tRNA ligase [Deltaproteobacteria bacterium]MBW1946594.1 threonine--tRNA ligase [Deltaproteobacteria bacterium]MBW1966663.1 threonine--tRNA ligase [Deltaproteobacteria bacterium]MBW2098509.1 threonine--tRNA ligase [Deltaproteobacteria bacterium]
MPETDTDTITVIFNGRDTVQVASGTPASELLASMLSRNSAKKVILVRIDGELKDISTPLTRDCRMEPVFPGDDDTLEVLRHTAAHIMAQAVKELFPDVQIAIGPAIENGFYYDFDYQRPFTPEDLEKIEARMEEIVKRSQDITRQDVSIDDARKRFEKLGEKYKIEILNELGNQGEKEVSIYSQGEFVDLCRGPHLPHTGHLKAFKLTGLAGAYWKGDETQPMLQRIYGTAFFDKKSLKEYLNRLEEAKKRDHRRLGRDLDLFSVNEEIGPGLILWHPKGGIVRKIIEDFWRDEHFRRGYDMLFSPHIARRDLWKTSGHLDFYSENMYLPMEIDDVSYQLRPMNCPFHIAIYNSRIRSYRELPMRWCELGTVYRYERTGTLHGLMRVRGFTQDDGHIFCRPDQLGKEIHEILDLTLYVLRVFGFDRYEIYLSTRPDKYVGSDENWERATDALGQALEAQGLTYEIDPGEGVFYGPKIDIKIKDCLDRSWQCSTIQVDFNLPERFDMRYIGDDGRPHTPIMVHRALLGSLERFFGVLIEHHAGAFPLWLAPFQAIVVTVTDRQDQWAESVAERLRAAGVRTKTDFRNEKLGKKIREAQLEKIPYMLIVGDQEVRDMTVSPRTRKGQKLAAMSVDDFVAMVKKECRRVFKGSCRGERLI